MSLFSRMKHIIDSNVNDLLDKVEDPVKMIHQTIRDAEADIVKANTAYGAQLAHVRLLDARYREATETMAKRQGQAVKAIEKGDEELARTAIAKKQEAAMMAEQLKKDIDVAQGMLDKLAEKLQEMKSSLSQMKTKREMLVSRMETAKATQHMNEVIGHFGENSAVERFAKLEEKVTVVEAKADASEDLLVKDQAEKKLDEQLDAIGHQEAIDRELEELKASLASQKA